MASFSGFPPQPVAVPIKCRTGSTSVREPNMRFVSGMVPARTSSASRTFSWLAVSQFGMSKLAGDHFAWLDLDGILQAVGLFNVLADRSGSTSMRMAYQHVSRSDLFFCVSVGSSAVDHLRHILILIDYLHRHETLACLGQRDRHRSSVEIKHGAAPRRTPSRQAAGGACDRLETPAR